MADECVPNAEMRRTGPSRDPIDAVLHGDDQGDDLLDVAALVHDLRAAYTPAAPLVRGPELAAFTEAHLETERPGRKRHSMLTSLSGFVGTLTGKIVLGTAVTAASVGGLHAADVVDVPALPDTGTAAEQSDHDAGDRAGGAAPTSGSEIGEEKAAAAAAYTDAVRAWTDCVAEAAAGQGDEETRTTAGFDPRAGCGEQPRPADFGLTDLPDAAADAAQAAQEALDRAAGGSRPETPAPADAGVPDDAGEHAPDGGPQPTAPETPAPGGGAPDGVGAGEAPAGRP